MATLPVKTVIKPDVLAGRSNGMLPSSILVNTAGQAGGPTVRLVQPAARAWIAMCDAASKAGHVFKATSLADSYRDYDNQRHTFLTRYTRTFLEDRPIKRWDSDGNGVIEVWYQRPGTAQAAVPGTSNHGWGLAVDIGEERDGDSGVESIDQGSVNWLIGNADRFGFSAEIQSEPWHWRYYRGDNVPAAVLEFEGEDMATPEQIAEAVWHKVITDTGLTAQTIMLRAMLASQAAQAGVAAANAKLDALAGDGAPADVALILAGVQAQLTQAVADMTAVTQAVGVEARDAVADLGEGGATQVRADAG